MTSDDMDEIIRKITQIRANNNLNWMGLLSIAMHADPKKARELLRLITDNDVKVSSLTRKLSDED